MEPDQIAAARQAVAGLDRHAAASRLREEGLSLAEVAEVLEVSRARAWQLAEGWTPPSRPRVVVRCTSEACPGRPGKPGPWWGQRRASTAERRPCPTCGSPVAVTAQDSADTTV